MNTQQKGNKPFKQATNTKKISNQTPQNFDYLLKIIIIGDSGVGKSTLLCRYTNGQFQENYYATIGMNYLWRIEQVDGVNIKLQIWDTAGQEKYKTITQNYYKTSDGAIISFSINSRQSFNSVRSWISNLTDSVKESTQVILVGTKSDLKEQRQIDQQEALALAKQNNLQYIECSAKTGEFVDKVFRTLTIKMKEKQIDQKIKQGQQADLREAKRNSQGTLKLSKFKQGLLNNKCCNN